MERRIQPTRNPNPFVPLGALGEVRAYPAAERTSDRGAGPARFAPVRRGRDPRRGPVLARIAGLGDLREHLQWAVELEHSTLPVYFCALYSLDPARNPVAAEVLTSIFVEEMLHMALVANLDNAIGGQPEVDVPRMLPGYPMTLPHGALELSLLPFGLEALLQLQVLECPANPTAPPESDGYETIGQFYEAIEIGFRAVCDELGEQQVFCGDPARQIADEHLYGGAGRLIAVHDLQSALAALDEIVAQGEGAAHADVWDGDHDMFHPERDEVGHYYRLNELLVGRRYRQGDTPQSGPTGDELAVDWDGVRPMERNPRMNDHEGGSPVRAAQEEFNDAYRLLLGQLQLAFNGNPEALRPAIGTMYGLKARAEALMQLPTNGGRTVAGPTFEYAPASRK